MPKVTLPLLPNAPQLTVFSVIDILLVAALIYQVIVLVRGRRAESVFFGISILVLVYLAAAALHLELLRTLLATLAPYTAFALIVIFQSEVRRALSRLGRTEIWRPVRGMERRDLVRDIQFAAKELAERRIGALIVLERDVGLRTFIESGTKLDACVSRELLLSVFEPKTAMHDGAVIIRRDRIAAAGCFLPLTMNPELAGRYGTRHRAAIGITEETDCISVVISEETGRISIAAFGGLKEHVNLEQLETRLVEHLSHKEKTSTKTPFAAAPAPATAPQAGNGVPADHTEVNQP